MDLALISFDGLDPRVIYEKRNKLDNFDKVMENSMHGEWRTPGHTIPSFIATLTGQPYEVVNFHWDGGRGEYQRHRQTGFDFLWDETDKSMTLLNIPVLYPPENIDDVMVSGFLAPDDVTDTNLARPVRVQDMLNDMGYVHDIDSDETFEELGPEGMLEYVQKMMIKRIDVARVLIEDYHSDLFYGVWTGTDRWFHQCAIRDLDVGVYDRPFFDLYSTANIVLGDMLDILPHDIPVIIFSDHGFSHFKHDDDIHKGHMYRGWYCIYNAPVPSYRDDSLSIYDLYPTVKNYLDGEVGKETRGRILFHTEEQDKQVKDRLGDLGYL